MGERIMDSNDIERERGITILARTAPSSMAARASTSSIRRHADFAAKSSGMSMVTVCCCSSMRSKDRCRRHASSRASPGAGLKAIVVVNKIDRHGSRPAWVVDQPSTVRQARRQRRAARFPVIYASACRLGEHRLHRTPPDMSALFEAILTHVPHRRQADLPLQLQISTLDYNSYVGASASAVFAAGGAPRRGRGAALWRSGPRTRRIGQC